MGQGVMLCLALLLASSATAQTVQKCVAPNGHARYQSEPCGRGERVAEVWDATPEPVAAPEPAPRQAHTRRMRRPSRGVSRRRIAYGDDMAHDSCGEARAYRDLAERRAGLDRNYTLLATLQDRVFEACR